MRCIHCQGEMEWKAAPFQVDRKAYHLTLLDLEGDVVHSSGGPVGLDQVLDFNHSGISLPCFVFGVQINGQGFYRT